MKQQIMFNLEEGDDPLDYAAPLKALCAIHDICQYLRELEKYGSPFKTVEEAVSKIRRNVRDLCDDIREEWKA